MQLRGTGRLRPAGGARGPAGCRERAEAARTRAHPAAPGQYPARWGRCPPRCRPRAAQPRPPGPRVGPAPCCTAHGPRGRWSEYPAARSLPPQAPNGEPGGDAGRPCPAAKGKDRAGPRAPGLVPNQACGGAPGLHPYILCRMQRRGAHARSRPFIQAGPPVGGRPPRACGTSGVMGPFLKRQGASRFPSPSFSLLLLALLSVPPALCPPRGLLWVCSLLTKPIPTL